MNDHPRHPFALQSVNPRYVEEPLDVETAAGPGAPNPAPKSRIGWGEVVSVLFKHKWTIGILTGCGVLAAGITFFSWPVVYSSDANLLVAYVLENPNNSNDGDSSHRRGTAILNTEIKILTSLDLARDVAVEMGPELLVGSGAGNGPEVAAAAAQMIRDGLQAEPTAPDTGVIGVTFQHHDSGIVQPVLIRLIDLYRRKHAEIHQSSGLANEFLTSEAERLRTLLSQTEDELRQLREQSGVLSVEETRRLQAQQISAIQQDIRQAEADLAERKAALGELARTSPEQVTASASQEEAPPAKVAEYQQVTNLLGMLRRRAQDLLSQYTPDSTIVRGVRGLIAENEGQKAALEREYPGLVAFAPQDEQTSAASAELRASIPEVRALESRIATLKEQLASLQADFSSMNALEPQITELERRKELQEQYYTYFTTRLQQGRADATLGAYRISNISVIQQPTTPHRETGTLVPVVAALGLSGLVAGLGFAFLLELLFDPSIKRPAEVERTIGLPLYLTIPKLEVEKKSVGEAIKQTLRLPVQSDASSRSDEAPSQRETASDESDAILWSDDRGLRPFFDALRNRLLYDFELRNFSQRPKLVAVTSCNEQAGVSTLAAGLAASLSEGSEGNVLLVDMNPLGERAPYRFEHEADPQCGVVEMLEREKSDDAATGGRVYVASHSAGKDVSHILPGKFGSLIPKFRSSGFDYIIFDLPPVSQMSTTTQLARHMDSVLMVVESEKTNRGAAKRAGALLAQPGVHVGVVFNKTRTYAPGHLEQEYLGSA